MRGAMNVVSRTLEELSLKNDIKNIIDIGLALGMQIPWTYELANKHSANLFSVDINLKKFFENY